MLSLTSYFCTCTLHSFIYSFMSDWQPCETVQHMEISHDSSSSHSSSSTNRCILFCHSLFGWGFMNAIISLYHSLWTYLEGLVLWSWKTWYIFIHMSPCWRYLPCLSHLYHLFHNSWHVSHPQRQILHKIFPCGFCVNMRHFLLTT